MGTLLEGLEPFFNTCIESFFRFDGISCNGQLVTRNDISKLKKKAPDNFIIAPYVPQSRILHEARCF
ncbi:hypothetical protein CW304_27450 [Bacillus sp. UFRGS-B20]|nr:hypothetical protein CW304_27450 [Bacillus sp. UFRGS-B20]